MSDDPYALHADGTAVDPGAFREATLADASLAEDLKKDERASRVLASGDDAALQELLKEVHQVRLLLVMLVKREGGGMKRRRREAVAVKEREGREKSNCSCFFFFVRRPLLLNLLDRRTSKQTNKQEESRRAERESRAMSERTIDAQRASAPVPR